MTEDSQNKPDSNSENVFEIALPDVGEIAGINLAAPDAPAGAENPVGELSLNSINNPPLDDASPALELSPQQDESVPESVALDLPAPEPIAPDPGAESPASVDLNFAPEQPSSADHPDAASQSTPEQELSAAPDSAAPDSTTPDSSFAQFSSDDFNFDQEHENRAAREETREQFSIPQEAAGQDPIQQIKNFSEKLPMEKVQVPAAFPFSLIIEGELLPEEKEKLLDVLSRENMGFREVDLEPQLQNDRILIPRISEYAGVILIQALRGTCARMRLGPSDTIFSTDDTVSESDPLSSGFSISSSGARSVMKTRHDDSSHAAERLAVTSADSLPQLPRFEVIDTILVSAILTSNAVEAARTAEYQEMVENLKREIKYKAHRKGAAGIVRFQVELQSLSLSSQYRLNVSGTAVKSENSEV